MNVKELLIKIKGIFNRQKKLPESQKTELPLDSRQRENDFKNKIQEETKVKMEEMKKNRFKGLNQEQLEEEILKEAGISENMLKNPISREKLFEQLRRIEDPNVFIRITDKVEIRSRMPDEFEEFDEPWKKEPEAYLIDIIKKKWKIGEKSVEFEKRTWHHRGNGGLLTNDRIERCMCDESTVSISEKEITCVQSDIRDNTCSNAEILWEKRLDDEKIYNLDGVQIKNNYSEKINDYYKKSYEEHNAVLERVSIDKVKCTKADKEFFVDLTNSKKDISTLDAATIGIGGDTIYPEMLYKELEPGSQEEMLHKKKVQEKISKSKYARGCYKYAGQLEPKEQKEI